MQAINWGSDEACPVLSRSNLPHDVIFTAPTVDKPGCKCCFSDTVVTRRGNQEFERKKAMPAPRTPVPVMTYKGTVDCWSKPLHLDRG